MMGFRTGATHLTGLHSAVFFTTRERWGAEEHPTLQRRKGLLPEFACP